MSQKFASARSVGTRLSADGFSNYFRSKKRGSKNEKEESQEPNEFQFDPNFRPFLLSHRKVNISTAMVMIVSGALMISLSPFCSSTVSQRCWTSENLASVYDAAAMNGEDRDKIRWMYGLRYIGGLILGVGIFYFILILLFHSWRTKMGIAFANKGMSSDCDGHPSNFNVYDIMVKAWVRDQRNMSKHDMEKEDVSFLGKTRTPRRVRIVDTPDVERCCGDTRCYHHTARFGMGDLSVNDDFQPDCENDELETWV